MSGNRNRKSLRTNFTGDARNNRTNYRTETVASFIQLVTETTDTEWMANGPRRNTLEATEWDQDSQDNGATTEG